MPSTTTALVQLDNVGKLYRGLWRRVRALDGVTFQMEPGEVFGLAGPNGAGKSTLIALLLGFLKPTTGAIRIAGLLPREFVERRGIGYLSELVTIPPRWRLEEALSRYALLAGVESSRLRARVEELIELLGLGEHLGKQIRQLSKGSAQRVGLAQALLHNEQVIVLDEPTHGLDPLWTQRFRDIVAGLRQPDRLIFIASHNLDEMQRVTDRVAILDQGRVQRIVRTRATADATGATPYRVVIARGLEAARELMPDARVVAANELELPPVPVEALNASLRLLLAHDVLIASVAPVYSSLERQFREAVADGNEDRARRSNSDG